MTNPLKFAFFKFTKLPAAFIAGLKIGYMDAHKTTITVRYNWLNQNPFKSMYFAVQSMAAEMSTGLFAVGQTYQRNPPISMLVVSVEGKFFKKATGLISFTCNDGILVSDAIEESIATGAGKTVVCKSIGTNEVGELVSEFLIIWSFKVKQL
ncbi:MAG: thioesterase [Sphingobacteriia bacterium]|nr:MAG: thioesterase [Sphingobacteriia bacterium]TAG29413.1 MAG: thioesterase [Sphingobacteriia bacterium]